VANSNRRNNSIEYLFVNGIVSSNHSEIKEHILQFDNSFYSEQFSWQLGVVFLWLWWAQGLVGVSLWVLFWVFVGLCFFFYFFGVPFVYSLCT
jgi:hypothetical protein